MLSRPDLLPTLADDLVEREFRRWQGVIRCRPLGKDRFFCRYWWFDGIGGMDLATSAYSTGRLFVQGPSQEDWDFITRKSGQEEAQAMARRTREEGADEDGLLGIDEWGYYESEAEASPALVSDAPAPWLT